MKMSKISNSNKRNKMTWQKVDEVGPCKWNRLSVNGVRLYPLEDSASLIYKITSHRLLPFTLFSSYHIQARIKIRATNLQLPIRCVCVCVFLSLSLPSSLHFPVYSLFYSVS